MNNKRKFHVFTFGWGASLINGLCTPIGLKEDIIFTHGLIGNQEAELGDMRDTQYVYLGFAKGDQLPPPDYDLLATLESVGVPTVRTMILGDRILRNRPEREALSYVTLLAQRLRASLLDHQPDLVLGAFDQVHGMLGLAVAKSLGIPWVCMSFTVIPENLTGFCRGLTPNTLIDGLASPVDSPLQQTAKKVMEGFRHRDMNIFVFRPPTTAGERLSQVKPFIRALWKRLVFSHRYNRFVFPTTVERIADVVRRTFNALTVPADKYIGVPPGRRFVFFPLQMKPEMSTETQAPFFQDQLALVRQLCDAIPIDVDFVVKLHLSDPDNYNKKQLSRLMNIPNVKLAHPSTSSFSFLERASMIIGITGTPCLEGALLGKPVLLFGDSPYIHFPLTERALRPDEWHQQIRRMLDLPPASDAAIIDAFATYMARYMPGRLNDWSKPISEEDLTKLTECFRRLRLYVEEPGCRTNWYNAPPFVSAQSSKAEPQPCQF